ncbi:hypothetical protein AALO_G00167730 [Alosa alosa]|uniref:Uncharacterized protein n=1 Tax=Alosa alosa TaxID=278164 RepID=A0AAV6GCG9_9TELE|nr:hypothetical protein AALO_G00167730 [Alosa alosa]
MPCLQQRLKQTSPVASSSGLPSSSVRKTRSPHLSGLHSYRGFVSERAFEDLAKVALETDRQDSIRFQGQLDDDDDDAFLY